MPMILEVPDEIVEAMKVPNREKEKRAKVELACGLYSGGVLSCGKAAKLAGMSRIRFGEELAERNIPRHYTENDLQQDI